MNPALLDRPRAPGRRISIALAVVVHLLLAALLIYGVRWQSERPEAVEVELVLVQPDAVAAPVPETLKPVPKPEPPPQVKPEPRPLPPPPKPDIAVKEKEKPKPPPKVEPKSNVDPFQEVMKRELEQLTQQKSKVAIDEDLAQAKAAQVAGARNKGVADYLGKIRAKIRGNIVLPPDVKGNPETVFDVTQLPSGEVLSVKLRKSSGLAALDAAIERAILKSSPLPKPEQGDLFSRSLELRFRPLDE